MPKKELANEAKLWVKDNFPSLGKYLWPTMRAYEQTHGTEAMGQLLKQKSIGAGGDLEAIYSGSGLPRRYMTTGRGHRSYIFQQGDQSIDPFLRGPAPQVINIEGGNRLWRFPQEGIILNTVLAPGCGTKATGPCGPQALWAGVHRGDKPIEQVLMDLKSHNFNEFGGFMRDFQHGSGMPTLHDYLVAHDFARHFPENAAFDLSEGIQGLYPQLQNGILRISPKGYGMNHDDTGGHILAVIDGLPVENSRWWKHGANTDPEKVRAKVRDIYSAPDRPVDWRSPDPHVRPSLFVTHMFPEDFHMDFKYQPTEDYDDHFDIYDQLSSKTHQTDLTWRSAYGRKDQK